MSLTGEQQAVVDDRHPFIALVAPAGSGKTSTLASKVAAIVDRSTDQSGTRALALTFTNRAARELEERTHGQADAFTFHGFAARIRELVDPEPFTIYDETDTQDVLCQVGEELGILKAGGWKDGRRAADKVRKNAAAVARYETILRRSRAVDFDMLIRDSLDFAKWRAVVHEHFSAHHFCLDEQQDADPAQWELVNACKPRAVFMVGDPRQTIYTWRKADPKILLDRWDSTGIAHALEVPGGRDTPPVPPSGVQVLSRRWHAHALTANFRSAPEVVALGNRVASSMDIATPPMVAHRELRGDCTVFAADDFEQECDRIVAWTRDRIAGWDPSSGRPAVMILARAWYRLDRIRERLRAAGIPHEHLADAGSFWAQPEARAATRLLKLALNPSCDWLARSLANWPDARLTEIDLLRAQDVAARENVPLSEVLSKRTDSLYLAAWHPAVLAELVAKEPNASLALAAACVHAVHAFTQSGRTTRAENMRNAIRRAEAWCARGAAAGLPTSPKAFLRWLAFAQPGDEAEPKPVWLSTVHGVKGLEADHVAITGLHAGGFDAGDAEERRLFFVAATRARDGLLCTFSRRSGYEEGRQPGTFWREAQETFGEVQP